jgi:hypothetical protein
MRRLRRRAPAPPKPRAARGGARAAPGRAMGPPSRSRWSYFLACCSSGPPWPFPSRSDAAEGAEWAYRCFTRPPRATWRRPGRGSAPPPPGAWARSGRSYVRSRGAWGGRGRCSAAPPPAGSVGRGAMLRPNTLLSRRPARTGHARSGRPTHLAGPHQPGRARRPRAGTTPPLRHRRPAEVSRRRQGFLGRRDRCRPVRLPTNRSLGAVAPRRRVGGLIHPTTGEKVQLALMRRQSNQRARLRTRSATRVWRRDRRWTVPTSAAKPKRLSRRVKPGGSRS